MSKLYIRLEFLIDSYIKVPCKFCRNEQRDDFKVCNECTLSRNDRIERTQKFLDAENSDWNKNLKQKVGVQNYHASKK